MKTDVYTKVVDYSDYAKQARMPKDYSEIYTAKKRFCFTHSEDFDGVFAGEIVRKFFGGKIKVVPINYGEAGYSTVLEDYDLKNADVVITDFSFDEKTMMKMAEVCRTVTEALTKRPGNAAAVKAQFARFSSVWTAALEKAKAHDDVRAVAVEEIKLAALDDVIAHFKEATGE